MAKEIIYRGVSLVALLISIVALCVAVFRTPELGFDYQGVLVGVLSLLVTVLIGWNIYTVLDSKQEIKRMVELVSNVSITADKANANIKTSLFSTLMVFYEKTDPYSYEYLHNAMLTITHSIRYGDVETAKRIADKIIKEINNGLGKDFSGIQKSSLAMILTNMQEVSNSIIILKDKILNLR